MENFCKNCTKCCRWPGTVTFKPEQLAGVAKCLGIEERDCANTFFELSKNRQNLQTKSTIDGSCIFIRDEGCLVYEHRPDHCRTFPYKWQRPEKKYMKECALYQKILNNIRTLDLGKAKTKGLIRLNGYFGGSNNKNLI